MTEALSLVLDSEHHCGPWGDSISISDYLGTVFIQLHDVCAQCLWPPIPPIPPILFSSFFHPIWGKLGLKPLLFLPGGGQGEEAGKLFLIFLTILIIFGSFFKIRKLLRYINAVGYPIMVL